MKTYLKSYLILSVILRIALNYTCTDRYLYYGDGQRIRDTVLPENQHCLQNAYLQYESS